MRGRALDVFGFRFVAGKRRGGQGDGVGRGGWGRKRRVWSSPSNAPMKSARTLVKPGLGIPTQIKPLLLLLLLLLHKFDNLKRTHEISFVKQQACSE